MKKSHKNKKAAMMRRAALLVKGLSISWTDPNPLGETRTINDQEVSHSNAAIRRFSWDIWNNHKEWLINTGVLLWRVDITIVFEYDASTQYESRQIVHRGKLFDIGTACESVIADAARHGENAVNAVFKCECLGNRNPKDSDYATGFEP